MSCNHDVLDFEAVAGSRDPTGAETCLDPRLEDIEDAARAHYSNDDPGHDWSHALRVKKTCMEIGMAVGADLDILIPAALLHDIVNVPKDHPDRAGASSAAADAAQRILAASGYLPGEITAIQAVIAEHSYFLGRTPSSLESSVLQDADRLDALGAIGILRAATCGCRLGAAYYDLADPFATGRPFDDSRYTIDHFFAKLLKLAEQFNTEMGRREAEWRVEYLRGFLAQLHTEIDDATGTAPMMPAINDES